MNGCLYEYRVKKVGPGFSLGRDLYAEARITRLGGGEPGQMPVLKGRTGYLGVYYSDNSNGVLFQ